MSITKKSVDTSGVKLSDVPGVADTKDLEIDKLESAIVERIDTDHPAVDNEPRKGASVASNQIDFNTPSGLATPEEQVEANLTSDEK